MSVEFDSENEYTLEDILSEIKSDAFISDKRKTPKQDMDEAVGQIVREILSEESAVSDEPEQLDPDADLYDQVFARVSDKPRMEPEQAEMTAEPSDEEPPASPAEEDPAVPEEEEDAMPEPEDEPSDAPQDVYERLIDKVVQTAEPDYEGYSDEVEEQIEEQDEYEEQGKGVLSILDYLHPRGEEPEPEEEELPEPDYAEEKKRFEKVFAAYTWRIPAAGVLALIMTVFTFLYEGGRALPFGLGTRLSACTGVMTALLACVMLLATDVVAAGVSALLHGRPDARSLVSVSAFITVIVGILTTLAGENEGALPFSAVSAFALVFAMWGERTYARAYAVSLRTVTMIREPKGVVSEVSEAAGDLVLKKYRGYTAGFYNDMMTADISERTYRFWTPMLLIASAVLAIVVCAKNKNGGEFPRIFSSILAAAAGFSGTLCFSLPFGKLAARLRTGGSAVAGWGGVCDLCQAGGVRMTDEDLFPPESIAIVGKKYYKDTKSEWAIRCTASVISASQSGLAPVFEQLAENQQISLVRVGDFSCYEGGIGGTVHGQTVLVGSEAFMTLMGIPIPENMDLKNAVYTAVSGELIAVFSLEYTPVTSVSKAVRAIRNANTKLLFAVRDFNITPLMLMQKFRLDMDGVSYLPIAETYRLSGAEPEQAERTCAVIFRDGLGPFGEVLTGARRLRRIARLCTVVSVASSVLGALLLFLLLFVGASATANGGNTLVYLVCMALVGFLLAGFVKNDRT